MTVMLSYQQSLYLSLASLTPPQPASPPCRIVLWRPRGPKRRSTSRRRCWRWRGGRLAVGVILVISVILVIGVVSLRLEALGMYCRRWRGGRLASVVMLVILVT